MSHDPTIYQDPDDLLRAAQRSTQRLRPPTQVPGYDFERFLGAGAYGEVWVAVDRNTGRRTAIKFYAHRGGLDWSLLSREVEKLAFLFADRYVVQLIDVGWNSNPPFYVMEFLERGSLADRIARGPLPVVEAVNLFRDVTIGLIHAHDKGVLHCDLKPANVLLDQDNRPRLADFGQARLSTEQSPALGTLFYMAPEQADLDAVPDARWDVYALGALLYCMLTGEPPHRTPDVVASFEREASLPNKLAAYRKLILQSKPPNKHRQVPGVDRDLAEIVDRCLQPSLNRRFPNPQAVLESLNLRSQRQARRPLLVLGALGPAVLLAVLSWFAWSAYGTAIRESDEALTARAVEANDFAAQFVAETVAGEIDRRWKTLEREAGDFDVRDQLARITAAPTFTAADKKVMQSWLQRVAGGNPDVQAASWVIMDGRGNQLARVPFDNKTVGRNYAFRDYFNGLGDQPETARDLKPIENVHLSNVFESTATKERKVAFSTPVWSTDAVGDARRRVVGVLSVTVALGKFAELKGRGDANPNQIAALVDLKPDFEDRTGAILEHPHLTERADGEAADAPLPAYFFPEADLKRLQTLRASGELHARSIDTANYTDDNYRDPIGDNEGERWRGKYAGRWLAAFRPVVVEGRSAAGDSGWVVVVQERYDAALKPAQELGRKLLRYGLVALGIVLGVVTALWGFVMIVLNEAPQYRWAAYLRRRLGLPTAGQSSTSGTAAGSLAVDRSGSAVPDLQSPKSFPSGSLTAAAPAAGQTLKLEPDDR